MGSAAGALLAGLPFLQAGVLLPSPHTLTHARTACLHQAEEGQTLLPLYRDGTDYSQLTSMHGPLQRAAPGPELGDWPHSRRPRGQVYSKHQPCSLHSEGLCFAG